MGTEEVAAEDEDEEEAAFLRVGPEEATVRFDELSRASALSLSLSLSLSRFLGKCNVMLCDAISGDFWVVPSLCFHERYGLKKSFWGIDWKEGTSGTRSVTCF